MPVLSQRTRSAWVEIEGRLVKLHAVDRTQGVQSVNICDGRNRPGRYEERHFFPAGDHVSVRHAARFVSLRAFKQWIRARAYRQAKDR